MKGCLLKGLAAGWVVVVLAVGWKWGTGRDAGNTKSGRGESRPIPVEAASVRTGTIDEKRVFSGSLEASARMLISPKVSGRVARVLADLGDPVTRGQVLAELESEEYEQLLARAQAELAVAEAQRNEAENRLEIAMRERDRIRELRERGISSESALDAARAEYLIRSSALEVANATVTARESAVETAQIQLRDTRIQAVWSEGDDSRVVSERMVDEGDTISANSPIFTVVELQPVQAVVFVPERDYSRLSPGQRVELTTDAWPDRVFEGEIRRIAPVFESESRQARVEIQAENPDLALKPGLFIRATVTLDHVEGATLVPADAITRRGNTRGIFMVDAESGTARWLEVTPGIREGGWVQLLDQDVKGKVVTLGQQLLDDGSKLILPEEDSAGDDEQGDEKDDPS